MQDEDANRSVGFPATLAATVLLQLWDFQHFVQPRACSAAYAAARRARNRGQMLKSHAENMRCNRSRQGMLILKRAGCK